MPTVCQRRFTFKRSVVAVRSWRCGRGGAVVAFDAAADDFTASTARVAISTAGPQSARIGIVGTVHLQRQPDARTAVRRPETPAVQEPAKRDDHDCGRMALETPTGQPGGTPRRRRPRRRALGPLQLRVVPVLFVQERERLALPQPGSSWVRSSGDD